MSIPEPLGSRGDDAPVGEFRQLIQQRLMAVWLRPISLWLILGAWLLQNAWVHFGIVHVAALYPYGVAGSILLGVLFLADPLTLAYIHLLHSGIRRGLPGWPEDPALLLAGRSSHDLFRGLQRPVLVFILAEMVANFLLMQWMESGLSPELRSPNSTNLTYFVMALTAIRPASTSVICGTVVGRGIVSRYLVAGLGMLPILAVIIGAQFLTLDSRNSGTTTEHYGYYLAAIPVLLILGQIYDFIGVAIVRKHTVYWAAKG
jgi:hypothetical protein